MLEKLAILDIKKVFILSLMIGGGYYVNFFNSIEPLENKIQKLDQQINQETERKKDTEKTLQEQDRMRSSVVLLSEQYQTITKKLPSNLRSFDVIKTIDEFSKTSGVLLKSKQPLPEVKAELYDEVQVAVDIEGRFKEVAEFTYLLSNTERFGKVRNIEIERKNYKDPIKMKAVVVGFKIVGDAKK